MFQSGSISQSGMNVKFAGGLQDKRSKFQGIAARNTVSRKSAKSTAKMQTEPMLLIRAD